MNKLVILGAGGSGMDIVSIIKAINSKQKIWEIIGFLDDDNNKINKEIIGYKVIDRIENANKFKGYYFVSSIANPNDRYLRKRIWEKAINFGLLPATIVHPSAILYEETVIGDGVVINANCVIGTRVKIGNNVHVGYGCNFAHESIILDHCAFGCGVNLSSGVIIGENSYIGCGVSTTHDVSINSDILVTVGSAVVRNIDNCKMNTWIGNPAIPIKDLAKEKLMIKKLSETILKSKQ